MSRLINLTNRIISVYATDKLTLLKDLPPAQYGLSASFNGENYTLIKDDQNNTFCIVKHIFELDDTPPAAQEGVIYIVGWDVMQALHGAGYSNRDDFVAPDTSRSSAVRDKQGKIIGVTRFRSFWC